MEKACAFLSYCLPLGGKQGGELPLGIKGTCWE